MEAPQGQIQFQFVTTFFLTTVEELSMKKVEHGLVEVCGLYADDAL